MESCRDGEFLGGVTSNDNGAKEPMPASIELSTLPLIMKILIKGHILNHIRVAELIIQDQFFLYKLLDLFKMCEYVENVEGLHLILKKMEGIISLNNWQIFKMIFSNGYIMDIVGTLEYDPDLPFSVRAL